MNKIDKILPLIEKHGPEIVDYIQDLSDEKTDELNALKSEFSNFTEKRKDEQKAIPLEINGATVEIIEGPKGDDGEKGDKGDEPSDERLASLITPLIPEPIKGEDGEKPTQEELLNLIYPLIPEPTNGVDGITPTRDELIELIVPLIPEPVEFEEETPDTIVAKVNKSKSKIKKDIIDVDWKKYENKEFKIEDIKGLPETITKLKYSHAKAGYDQVAGGGGGTGTGAVSSVNSQTGVVVLTTTNIADSANKRYVTDANLTVIGNTSGTNTGNQTSIVGITGTVAQFNTAITDGDLATGGGTATGSNTGDNAVNSLYSGLVSNATHTGDVTGATALTIATAAVTNAKMANMATKTYKGRTTAGTGVPEDVSVATLKTDLVLVKADVGLGNVDNTSDVNKPVSTATQTALNLKANLASPTFTGTVAGITSTMVGLGNVNNTSDATKNSATATLTNKRITKRTGTTTSSATPTINTDNVDFYSLTAQAVDVTSFTTNLSGTPTEGQTLWIAITGTAARAITWGTSFEASTIALPITTVTTARLDVGFVWNTITSKFRCIAVA
jgi:hypothetical protein